MYQKPSWREWLARAGGFAGPEDFVAAGYLFLRPSGARYHGHVGWGFDLADGGALVGGVEMPHQPFQLWKNPARMGFWALRVGDPLQTMSGPPHWREWETRYDLVKRIDVERPNEREAMRRLHRIRTRPWLLFGRNCMDDAHAILVEFGARHLPRPSLDWGPIRFFNDVRAPAAALMNPVAPVDATLYAGSGLGGKRFSVLSAGGEPRFDDHWTAGVRSVVVRAGYLDLYPEPEYTGVPIRLGPGDLLSAREGYRVRSIVAGPRPTTTSLRDLVKFSLPSGPQRWTSPDMPHSWSGRGTVPDFKTPTA